MKASKRYLYDIILVVALLSVFLSIFFFVYKKSGTGDVARVYIGNDLVGEYRLDVDGEFTINGGTNKLKIENGKAFMIYAECPDGWCKNQGKINLCGERIVCLPNKVMIMIEEG